MEEESGWSVDLDTLSPGEIVQLLNQLKDSGHKDIQLKAKRALVERLRGKGSSNVVVIDYLVYGVVNKNLRKRIAKEWAEAIGITVKQFLEIADC